MTPVDGKGIEALLSLYFDMFQGRRPFRGGAG